MKVTFFLTIIAITYGYATAGRFLRNKRRADDTCGVPAVKPDTPDVTDVQDRIVGGNQAIPHSWPWQVRIYMCDNEGESCRDWCGGSIINPNEIATAAHCVEFGETDATRLKVRVGAHNLQQETEGEQTIGVARHNAGSDFGTDMAVLTLDAPITYNEHVSPVCLPSTTLNAGTVCYVTGFGQYERDAPMQSKVLKQAQLAIQDDDVCTSEYGQLNPAKELCASWGDGTSSCYGDSGGPFVCLVNGKWELHGIVSYGSHVCGDQPSVYVRVSQYTDWFNKDS